MRNPKAAAGLVLLGVSTFLIWLLWPQLVAKDQHDLLGHKLGQSSDSRAGVASLTAAVRSETVQSAAGKPYLPRPSVSGSGNNTSWLSIQGETSLRTRIGQALMSNNQEEAAAALNALLYCNKIASSRTDSPAAIAEAEMLVRFPGDEKILRRSRVQLRYAQIEDARKSCAYGDADLSKVTEADLRKGLAAKLADVNAMVDRLRQTAGGSIDWSRLSPEERGLLASGRLDILNRVVEGIGDRWDSSNSSTPEGYVSNSLARHLAMCMLGDLCEAGSFRFAEICVAYGACEGANVTLSVDKLILDGPMRDRTQKLAELIAQDVISAANRKADIK